MSPSRQIDTVNRTTTGSAATIISRSFAVETRLRRDTSCVWRHFIGEDFCAASMNTRERGEKKGKKEKKEKRRAPRLKKIHRKDIRETQKTRRGLSSIIRPEKAPRAFSSFCARPPPLLLPGPPPSSQRQATSSRLIENSIILFLSTGWRVLPRIDSRIYNATWVSELTASTGCAHTELAYWTAFWGPARKRAGSPRPLESV